MKKGNSTMLKVPQVAERLDVLASTVRIWCRGGRFPNAVQEETLRGPVWLIPESDLKGFEKRERGRPAGKKGAVESQTKTTRRLNEAFRKATEDEQQGGKKKGGRQ